MGRYIKNHSNYLLKTRHQDTKDGRIFEKDWVTIGGRERYYSRDKMKSYHGDNNFVFTITNIPTYQRKHRNSDFVATWKYDDVKDAKPIVNKVVRNNSSQDITDFAYYGSATELVRASVEDIILNFPPYLLVKKINGKGVKLGSAEEFKAEGIPYTGTPNFSACYIVDNPCALDFWHADPNYDEFTDVNHFLWDSWENYVYSDSGTDGTFKEISARPTMEYVGNTPLCKNIEVLWHTQIEGINLWGVQYYEDLIFICDNENFCLFPKKQMIDDFFDNIDGFEKQLLNRQSNPPYSNLFCVPKRTDYGTIDSYRTFTWPSKRFTYTVDEETIDFDAIDALTPNFSQYLLDLVNMGTILDEIYTDNIWGKMVHEAIKNYDWSYTRYYNDQVEEENIIGGKQTEKLIRLLGRGFDEVMRDAYGLRMTSRISYDGLNNVCDAELSDKLEVGGWEVFSTIPNTEEE